MLRIRPWVTSAESEVCPEAEEGLTGAVVKQKMAAAGGEAGIRLKVESPGTQDGAVVHKIPKHSLIPVHV